MLKPRGFVPWGLPGPTRDAAALAASTRNLNSPDSVREWPGGGLRLGVAGGGRVGVGWGPQITRIPFLCSPPDGLGHRNGPLVSTLIPNILFFMYGEVSNHGLGRLVSYLRRSGC